MFGALAIFVAYFLTFGQIACDSTSGAGDARAPKGIAASVAAMTRPRSGHTATLLPNGSVLIAGGMNGNGNYSDGVEIYAPATRSFTPVESMSARRVGHTATLLPNGKVLVAGGYNGDYLSTADIYDPVTGRFSPTGRMTMPRSEQTAVLLGNGKVLLAGGVGVGYSFLASAELYDPSTGTFSPTGSMTTPREGHTGTVLEDGRVLVAGGHKDRREAMTVYASAELYDPSTGQFARTGDMTTMRHKHAAVLLPGGGVLIVGGSDKRDSKGKYASAEIYDPVKGRFAAAGTMSVERYKLSTAVVALENGRVLIAGGAERAETYDPVARAFSPVEGRFDTARFFSTATRLADGRVLIAGGYDDHGTATASAWIYEPGS